jgi:hypothetical protein
LFDSALNLSVHHLEVSARALMLLALLREFVTLTISAFPIQNVFFSISYQQVTEPAASQARGLLVILRGERIFYDHNKRPQRCDEQPARSSKVRREACDFNGTISRETWIWCATTTVHHRVLARSVEWAGGDSQSGRGRGKSEFCRPNPSHKAEALQIRKIGVWSLGGTQWDPSTTARVRLLLTDYATSSFWAT